MAGNPPAEKRARRDEPAAAVGALAFPEFNSFRNQMDEAALKREKLIAASRKTTMTAKKAIVALHLAGSPSGTASSTSPDRSGEDDSAALRTALNPPVFWEAHAEMRGVFRLLGGANNDDSGPEHVRRQYYIHRRSVSPGLQEFIEALVFREFLLKERLPTLNEVCELISNPAPEEHRPSSVRPAGENQPGGRGGGRGKRKRDAETGGSTGNQPEVEQETPPPAPEAVATDESRVDVCVGEEDFLLGILDIGGELMRMATNLTSRGEFDAAVRVTEFLKAFEAEVSKLSEAELSREFKFKKKALLQSVRKVEKLAFEFELRRVEFPDLKPEQILAEIARNQEANNRESGERRNNDA
jgi:predicted translin family RNA/ssDNA-binding protein